TAYISEPHFILQFVESEIVRILAGQIGKFAAMADAEVLIVYLVNYNRQGCAGGHRVARSFGFAAMADVIIGLCLNKGESGDHDFSSSSGYNTNNPPCKVADKSEIVRILAWQIAKFAAMADVSFFSDCDEDINFVHLLFPSRGYWISGEISSRILAGQPDFRRDEAILERALTFFGLKGNCQLWDLNPRPFGTEPKSGALDHSPYLGGAIQPELVFAAVAESDSIISILLQQNVGILTPVGPVKIVISVLGFLLLYKSFISLLMKIVIERANSPDLVSLQPWQPWQMYSLSSIAYISEPHFTTEFVGDVTLWSDVGLKCGVYTCIRGIDSDGLNGRFYASFVFSIVLHSGSRLFFFQRHKGFGASLGLGQFWSIDWFDTSF
ncbi:hypothetical protein Tco_0807645, partial [Tanacetum coccineum]